MAHRIWSRLAQKMACCLKVIWNWDCILQWHYNKRNGISNHQPHDGLLNRLFKVQIKENIKALRQWPLCGEFTMTGEFPAQRASNAENVSIWWRHHEIIEPLPHLPGTNWSNSSHTESPLSAYKSVESHFANCVWSKIFLTICIKYPYLTLDFYLWYSDIILWSLIIVITHLSKVLLVINAMYDMKSLAEVMVNLLWHIMAVMEKDTV